MVCNAWLGVLLHDLHFVKQLQPNAKTYHLFHYFAMTHQGSLHFPYLLRCLKL
jgi:hypothetical protein